MKKLLTTLGVALLVVGCQRDVYTDDPNKNASYEYDGPATRLDFSLAGVAPAKTQSPTTRDTEAGIFAEGTPVKVFVFQRAEEATGPATGARPFKVGYGYTMGTTDATSRVVLVTGDLAGGGLFVPVNRTYDFAVVVNNTPPLDFDASKNSITSVYYGASSPLFGTSADAGVVRGFTHGSDILAAKKEGITVARGSVGENIIFDQAGAVGNKLPHMGSAVRAKATIADDMLADLIAASGESTVSLGVSGVNFTSCLPASANVAWGASGEIVAYAVQPGGYNTTFNGTFRNSPAINVSQSTQEFVSSDGDEMHLLPYPLRLGTTANTLNLKFNLMVNNGTVALEAKNLQAPPFQSGYRYRFVAQLAKDPNTQDGIINLILEIEPWTSVSWGSGMGSQGDGPELVSLPLGAWTGITWGHTMGGAQGVNYTILGVAGWRSSTWTATMEGAKPPVYAEPYILYLDDETKQLALGQWGGTETNETAKVTLQNALYVKQGSLVAVSNGNRTSNEAFVKANVKFNPMPVEYDVWDNIPYRNETVPATDPNAENYISSPAYHNYANVLKGKGDICRLVGLTDAQAKSLQRIGMLDTYNSGYRLPTQRDNTAFLGYTENQTVTAPGPWWSATGIGGMRGAFFPTVAANPGPTKFLPALGTWATAGTFAPSGTSLYYGTSKIATYSIQDDVTAYPLAVTDAKIVINPSIQQNAALPIRCVRN